MTALQWGRLSNDAFNVALFAYIAAMVGYFAYLPFRRHRIWVGARSAAFLGLGANVVSVVTRGLAAHRVPWGNMYEYSVLLALLVVAAYLLIVEGYYRVRTVGGSSSSTWDPARSCPRSTRTGSRSTSSRRSAARRCSPWGAC
jgi:hypothetical protein